MERSYQGSDNLRSSSMSMASSLYNYDPYPLYFRSQNHTQNPTLQNPTPSASQDRLSLNYNAMDNVGLVSDDFDKQPTLEDAFSRMSFPRTVSTHRSPSLNDTNSYFTNRAADQPIGLNTHSLNQMRSSLAALGLSTVPVNHRYWNLENRDGLPYSNLELIEPPLIQSYSSHGGQGESTWRPYYSSRSYPNSTDLENVPLNSSRRSVSFDELGRLRQHRRQAIQPLLNSSLHNRWWPRTKYTSLEQIRGKIVSEAKQQEGSLFLLNYLDDCTHDGIETIFLEVKDHVHDLMIDQLGTQVIQKLFEKLNQQQMEQFIPSFLDNQERLHETCDHLIGTRAMQKLIEVINPMPWLRSLLVMALKTITVPLTVKTNGHHVIQQCLKTFKFEDTKHLIEEIAGSCFQIAMDKNGCCVLQPCVASAEGHLKEIIMAEIANHAFTLSTDPYGNYVVQYIIDKGVHVHAQILQRLRGHFYALSINKYGSNVVERCLKCCIVGNAAGIIAELMENEPNFLLLLQDPYGNYVAQTALEVKSEEVHRRLVYFIETNYPDLHLHLHGKKVVAKARNKLRRM